MKRFIANITLFLAFLVPFFANCQCLKNYEIYFSPLKEVYKPNDTIRVVFNFYYERLNINWLSAVEIDYSDSWYLIPPYYVPDNCISVFDTISKWTFEIKDTMQGFFFEDWRSWEEYGDDCTYFFSFGWTMVVNDCLRPKDLILLIDTKSDSEYGTWREINCQNDDIIRITKKKDCFSVKK